MTRPTISTVAVGMLGLLASTLVGCSQVEALAPVSGKRTTEVRFAANDVLLGQHVLILTAPVCVTTRGTIECDGTTFDDEKITVTSEARDPANMNVTVGSRTIYQGSWQDVLDANARPAS